MPGVLVCMIVKMWRGNLLPLTSSYLEFQLSKMHAFIWNTHFIMVFSAEWEQWESFLMLSSCDWTDCISCFPGCLSFNQCPGCLGLIILPFSLKLETLWFCLNCLMDRTAFESYRLNFHVFLS
jgi:hypothetical protein